LSISELGRALPLAGGGALISRSSVDTVVAWGGCGIWGCAAVDTCARPKSINGTLTHGDVCGNLLISLVS
jgi:hypothetical protein